MSGSTRRRKWRPQQKLQVVLETLGSDSKLAAICRREGLSPYGSDRATEEHRERLRREHLVHAGEGHARARVGWSLAAHRIPRFPADRHPAGDVSSHGPTPIGFGLTGPASDSTTRASVAWVWRDVVGPAPLLSDSGG